MLVVMAAMAMVALLFALSTKADRRRRDHPELERIDSMTRTIPIAPGSLPALGFVPEDSTLIAGLHLAELRADSTSRALLETLLGHVTNTGATKLERWTGLGIDEIEHLVLALETERQLLLPSAVLIVQTRAPYNREKLQAALKAGRPITRGTRSLYRFGLGETAMEGVLWYASEVCFVVSLAVQDFDSVPVAPNFDSRRFPEAMRLLLNERMTAGTPAWLIGHGIDWDKWLKSPLVPVLPGDLSSKLASVRTLGFWGQFDQALTWSLELECANTQAVTNLASQLHEQGLQKGRLPMFLANVPGTERLANELSESLTEERSGDWLRIHAKTTPQAIIEAFGAKD
jgi:hypothetical protein